MSVSPKSSLFVHRSSEDGTTVATLRAVSHNPRSRVGPLLTEALQDCGCWVRERKGSESGLALTFELALRGIAELYPSLMECGLEFDRRAHCELAMLCTLSKHSLVHDGLRKHLSLRLEVTFADELEPGTPCSMPLHA